MNICITPDSIKLVGAYINKKLPQVITNNKSANEILKEIFESALADLNFNVDPARLKELVLQHLLIAPQLITKYVSENPSLGTVNSFNDFVKLSNEVYDASKDKTGKNFTALVNKLADTIGNKGIIPFKPYRVRFEAISINLAKITNQDALYEEGVGYSRNATDPAKIFQANVQRSIIASSNINNLQFKLVKFSDIKNNPSLDPGTKQNLLDSDYVFVLTNNKNELVKFDQNGDLSVEGMIPLLTFRTKRNQYTTTFEELTKKFKSWYKISSEEAYKLADEDLTRHLDFIQSMIDAYENNQTVNLAIDIDNSSLGFVELDLNQYTPINKITNLDSCEVFIKSDGKRFYPAIKPQYVNQSYALFGQNLSDLTDKDIDILFALLKTDDIKVKNWSSASIKKANIKKKLLLNYININNNTLITINKDSVAFLNNAPIKLSDLKREDVVKFVNTLYSAPYNGKVPFGVTPFNSFEEVTKPNQFYYKDNVLYITKGIERNFALSSKGSTNLDSDKLKYASDIVDGELIVSEKYLKDHIYETANTTVVVNANNELKGYYPYIAFKQSAEDEAIAKMDDDIVPFDFRSLSELNQDTVTEKQEKEAVEWFENENNPLKKVLQLNYFDQIHERGPSFVAEFVGSAINLYLGSKKTDIYHESFHAFSKGILSTTERSEMYNAIRKAPGKFEVIVYGKKKTVLFSEATDIEIEEYLAEEFRAYAMNRTGYNNSISVRIKQFFDKVWNVLKSIFGDMTYNDAITLNKVNGVINTMFNNLYEGNIDVSKFTPANSQYGLYKSNELNTEDSTKDEFSLEDINLLMKSFQSMISEFINVGINSNFDKAKQADVIARLLQLSTTDESDPLYKQRVDLYNAIATNESYNDGYGKFYVKNNPKLLGASLKYIKNNLETRLRYFKKQNTSDLNDYIINLLEKAINNFGDLNNISQYINSKENKTLIGLFLNNYSNFNLVQKEFEDALEEEKLNNDFINFDKSAADISLKETIDDDILQLLSNIQQYTFQGKGSPITNILGFKKLKPVDQMIAKLARLLTNTVDADQMYNKMLVAAKTDNEIKQVLKQLGNISEVKTAIGQNQWTGFWLAFNKFDLKLREFIIEKNIVRPKEDSLEEPTVSITAKSGQTNPLYKEVEFIWKEQFKFKLESTVGYTEKDADGKIYLSVESILFDYPTLKSVTDNPIEFLNVFGIEISELDEIKNILKNGSQGELEFDSAAITYIYENLKNRSKISTKFGKEKIEKDYLRLYKLDDLFKGFKYTNEAGQVVDQPNLNGYLSQLAKLEYSYSDVYSNFMEYNAEGEKQSTKVLNSTLSTIVNKINSSQSYEELISTPGFEFLNYEINPFVASCKYFVDMFNLQKSQPFFGKRNNAIKITVENLSGSKIIETENGISEDKGIASFSSDEKTKFTTDFHLTLNNKQEIVRTEAKTTTLTIHSQQLKKDGKLRKSGELVINKDEVEDIFSKDYNKNKNLTLLYDEFNLQLEAELIRITRLENLKEEIKLISLLNNSKTSNQPKQDLLSFDFDYLERGTTFYLFDNILSDKLKNTLKELELDKSFTLDKVLSQDLKKEIDLELKKYFEETSQKLYDTKNSDLFIADNILSDYANKDEEETAVRLKLFRTFTINNLIQNANTISLFFGDPALYNVPKEDFHKRIAGLISTGKIFRHDASFLNYINSDLFNNNAFAKKHNQTKNVTRNYNYNGTLNTAILKEKVTSSDYAKYYKEVYGIDSTEYEKMKEGDGQGWISFDAYRLLNKSSNEWSDGQEALYQKMLRNEPISKEDLTTTFPVRKFQYFGNVTSDNLDVALSLKAFHKFSLMPLIPQLIKGTKLQDLHERMMEQGIDYATFQSGSKLTSISKINYNTESNKFEPLYDEFYDNNRNVDNTLQFVKNIIHVNSLKNQVFLGEGYHGSITLPTQLRKISLLGLNDAGIPIDYIEDGGTAESWEALSETEKLKQSANYVWNKKYNEVLDDMQSHLRDELLDDLGLTYNKEKNEYEGNTDKLLQYLKDELTSKELLPSEIDFIIDNGKLRDDLSLSLQSETLEKLLVTLVDKKLRRLKINGESLVQVAGTMFEKLQKPSESDLINYGSNGLKFYHQVDENGNVVKDSKGKAIVKEMEVKISLQGDFKKLLYAKHPDGKQVAVYNEGVLDYETSLARLNQAIKNNVFREQNKKLLTIAGVRIPTQGPNAIEAATIAEFLPEWSGNIVILPTEIVAKSGADYDVDKIYWVFPNIVMLNNKPQLQTYSKSYVDLDQNNLDIEKIEKSIEKINDNIDELYNQKNELYNSVSILSDNQKEKNKEVINVLNDFIARRKAIYKEISDVYNKKGKYELIKRNEQTQLHKKLKAELSTVTDEINSLDEFLSNDYSSALAELIGIDSVRNEFNKLDEKIKIEKEVKESLYKKLNDLLSIKYGASIAGLENQFLNLIIEKVTNPTSFKELITANTTDEVKPTADLLESKIKKKYNKFYRRNGKKENGKISNTTIYEYNYNLNKQQENSVGKDSLGIAAIAATYYAVFNSLGLKLYAPSKSDFEQYNKDLELLNNPAALTEDKIKSLTKSVSSFLKKNYNIKLKHNNINGAISVSNNKNVSGKVISDLISQLVNGYVDVAKAAWIFNAQGTKENTPTLLFMVMSGIDIKSAILFSSNPLVIEYNQLKKEMNGVYSNLSYDPEVKSIDSEKKFASKSLSIIKEKYKNLFSQIDVKNIKPFGEGSKEFDPKDSSTWEDNELYKLATSNKIEPRHLEGLIHYIEIEKIANDINNFEALTKFDTQKVESISDVEKRITDTEKFRSRQTSIPAIWWDLIQNSSIGKFNNDKLILALFQNKFKVRNNKALVKKSLELESVKGVLDKVLRTDFKNDFLWFLYQNSVYSNKSYNGYSLVESSDPNQYLSVDNTTKTILYGKNYLTNNYKEDEFKDVIKFFDLNDKSSGLLEFVKFKYEYDKVKFENISLGDSEFYKKYYYLDRPGDNSFGRNYVLQRLALYNTMNPKAMFDNVAGVAGILKKIISKYPELKKYALIEDVRFNYDEKAQKQNIWLPLLNDLEMASVYKEDMLELKNYAKAPEVMQFFNLLDHIAIMQTGMNRRSQFDITRLANPYTFNNAIVNSNEYSNIIDALNELDADYNRIEKLPYVQRAEEFDKLNGQIIFQFYDLFVNMSNNSNYRKRVKGYNYGVNKLDFSKVKKLSETITSFNNVNIVTNFENIPKTAVTLTENKIFSDDYTVEEFLSNVINKNIYILNKQLVVPEEYSIKYSQDEFNKMLLDILGIDNSRSIPSLVYKSKNVKEGHLSIAGAERKPIVSVKDDAMANASTVAIATYIKPINPAYKSSTKEYINYINKNTPGKIANSQTKFSSNDSVWVFGAGIFEKAYVGSSKEEFENKVKNEFEKSYVPLIKEAIKANVLSFNVGTASGIDKYTRDFLKNSGYFEIKRYTAIGTYYEYVKDLNRVKVDLFNPSIKPVTLKDLQVEDLLTELFPNGKSPEWVNNLSEKDYINIKTRIRELLNISTKKLDLQFNTKANNGQAIGFVSFLNNKLLNSNGARIDIGYTPYASYIEEIMMEHRNKLILEKQKLVGGAKSLIQKPVIQIETAKDISLEESIIKLNDSVVELQNFKESNALFKVGDIVDVYFKKSDNEQELEIKQISKTKYGFRVVFEAGPGKEYTYFLDNNGNGEKINLNSKGVFETTPEINVQIEKLEKNTIYLWNIYNSKKNNQVFIQGQVPQFIINPIIQNINISRAEQTDEGEIRKTPELERGYPIIIPGHNTQFYLIESSGNIEDLKTGRRALLKDFQKGLDKKGTNIIKGSNEEKLMLELGFDVTKLYKPEKEDIKKIEQVNYESITDFNLLTEFTAEQKQNILNTFVEKYKVSEEVAIDNINKGLKENRQSTIEQLKKCY